MGPLVAGELSALDSGGDVYPSLSVERNVDVFVEVLSVTVVDSCVMGPLVEDELPALDPIDDVDLSS